MFEWLWTTKQDLQHWWFAALFLTALWKGAAPERILSGVFAGVVAVHLLYHLAVGGSIVWHHLELGHLAIDCAIFAITVPVALQANRTYPLWIGSAQIIAVMAHVYRFSLTEIDRFAYYMMSIAPSYIQLIALTLGLGFHMWRRRMLGSYPSWRSSFSPAPALKPKRRPGG
ncbi:hypothetical protein [Novosphingobium beihaiensis]|uniref:Uncharacterized protein n=1 Tax=Novosphingobium beihaiensis TaxID=2930389 RepID=A0ABT0BLU9_9SPHN|nr:hypothetical protein [Novosphingobium beihaiensis]MCJ2186020.1 hypothetical protein [Novosphingobium beihaiensis]